MIPLLGVRACIVDFIALACVGGTVVGCIAFLVVGPLPTESEWQQLMTAQWVETVEGQIAPTVRRAGHGDGTHFAE